MGLAPAVPARRTPGVARRIRSLPRERVRGLAEIAGVELVGTRPIDHLQLETHRLPGSAHDCSDYVLARYAGPVPNAVAAAMGLRPGPAGVDHRILDDRRDRRRRA